YFTAPARRAAVEAALGGFFRVGELILELGQVGCRLQPGQAFGRVARDEPRLATHVDITNAFDIAGGFRLGPRFSHAVEPDLGVDVQVAPSQCRQSRQSFDWHDFGIAAIGVFDDVALYFHQHQVTFPVHTGKAHGAVKFALR